jgi:hypothetical protein
MLQFDWEEVEGAAVEAVLATGSRAMNDGSLVCDQIALVLGAKAVVIRVNEDTDEVIVSLEGAAIADAANWQTLDGLAEMASRRLGWCWIGRNYRGYLDTFTVALDGIDPSYVFTGAASALQCMRVEPIVG